MHSSVLTWVEAQVRGHKLNQPGHKVLEVGSYNVNGSVRPFFDQCDYLGIDIVEGPGVDEVVPADDPGWWNMHAFDHGQFHKFNVVVSTEMLEHDLRPWLTLDRFGRVMHKGATLILTCRGFNEQDSFAFHNPPDRWRFSAEALQTMASDAGFKNGSVVADPQAAGWFMLARF